MPTRTAVTAAVALTVTLATGAVALATTLTGPAGSVGTDAAVRVVAPPSGAPPATTPTTLPALDRQAAALLAYAAQAGGALRHRPACPAPAGGSEHDTVERDRRAVVGHHAVDLPSRRRPTVDHASGPLADGGTADDRDHRTALRLPRQRRRPERVGQARARGLLPRRGRLMGRRPRPAAASRLVVTGLSASAAFVIVAVLATGAPASTGTPTTRAVAVATNPSGSTTPTAAAATAATPFGTPAAGAPPVPTDGTGAPAAATTFGSGAATPTPSAATTGAASPAAPPAVAPAAPAAPAPPPPTSPPPTQATTPPPTSPPPPPPATGGS